MAIVKATNHVECPPKERHIRSEFFLLLLCLSMLMDPFNFPVVHFLQYCLIFVVNMKFLGLGFIGFLVA